MISRKTKSNLIAIMKSDARSFPHRALRFLITLSDSQRAEVFSAIQSNSILKSKYRTYLYSHSLPNLGTSFTYNNTLSNTEAFEYACFLTYLYSDVINRYLYLRDEYEKQYLLGNYDNAKSLLDLIDKEICVSLWACGQHMLLKEHKYGLTENKQLLDQFSHSVPNNYVTQAVLFYYSVLAEANTSYDNYQNQINKFLKQLPESSVKSYLAQKLSLVPPNQQDDFSLILQIDSQYSIIDLYNDLEIFIPIFFYNDICEGTIRSAYLSSFASLIESPVAKNVKLILSLSGRSTFSEEPYANKVYSIIEQYTIGNYTWVLENALDYLVSKPYDFQIAVLFCKALIHNNLDFPINFPIPYVKSIYSIYKMDNEYKDSVLYIKKSLKQNHGFSLHIKMQTFLNRKGAANQKLFLSYSGLLDEALHPNFVQFLCAPLSDAFITYLSPKCPNAVLLTTILDAQKPVVLDKALTVSTFYYPFITAEEFFRQGNYQQAEEVLITAEQSCDPQDLYTYERIMRLRLRILGKENNYAQAIHLLVSSYFRNETLFERLASEKGFSIPSRIRDPKLIGNIDYVIYVFLSHPSDYHKQISAYSNYLDLNNFSSISCYIDSTSVQDIRSRFFLEHICTINLLKRDATLCLNDISAESVRLSILQKLYKTFRQKAYLDEINEISTNEVIRGNLRSINRSKINVDIEKIYTFFQPIWEENYNKYHLLSKSLIKIIDLNLSDESFKSLAENLNMMIANSPDVSQETIVLKGILEQILDAFLFNTQFGLETYLSSRLRHGYCKEQLSSFLNELHLISLRNEGDNQYLINDYWEIRLLAIPDLRSYIIQLLNSFTCKIEQKIEEIRGSWLRIKNTTNPNGMFDYSSFVDTYLVAYQGEYISEFRLFYKHVVNLFWGVTDSCLSSIRERIDGELQEYFIDTIDELEKGLDTLDSVYCDAQASHVIRELKHNCALAKSKVITIIREFQSVFSINKSEYNNFYMHDLSDSCQRITEKLFPNSGDIQWIINADTTLLFDGRYFASFVDMLCILINNCITHSGYSDMSHIIIDVRINESTSVERKDFFEAVNAQDTGKHVVTLSVTNNVLPSTDMQLLEQKLQFTFEAIQSEKGGAHRIQSEGGSGLYKFAKTAEYNLDGEYCIYYSFDDHNVTIGYEFIADNMIIQEDEK